MLVVAKDAAKQADIGCRDVVVVIELNGCQCRDIDAIFLLVGYLLCQDWVKSMVPFKDDDIVGAYLELPSLENSLAPLEVIARQLHLFAIQQLIHLLVEECSIYSPDTLEVILAIGILGCINAVDEVVIGADGMRPQATSHREDCQSLGRCCLAATARPCKQDNTSMPVRYLVSNVAELLRLQSLADINEVGGMTLLDGMIQFANRLHAKDFLPSVVFPDNIEHLLVLRHYLFQLRGVLLGRSTNQHAVVELDEVEEMHLTGASQQATVEIIDGIT